MLDFVLITELFLGLRIRYNNVSGSLTETSLYIRNETVAWGNLYHYLAWWPLQIPNVWCYEINTIQKVWLIWLLLTALLHVPWGWIWDVRLLVIIYINHICLIFTRGQFWPPGIVVACVFVYQSLACPHDNSSPVQAGITKITTYSSLDFQIRTKNTF